MMPLDEFVRLLPSEREQVSQVAARWKQSYYRGDVWQPCHGGSQQIHDALAVLPETATAADVAAIIGNASWVGHHCRLCDRTKSEAYDIGQDRDYESDTVTICRECLQRLRDYIAGLLVPRTERLD
jgi:hypothetical protein